MRLSNQNLYHPAYQYYFQFIYEYCFNEFSNNLNIPKLDEIFNHNCSDQKVKNLLSMIEDYKLVIYHREYLRRSRQIRLPRSDSETPIFIHFIVEADRINDIIFSDSDYETTLRHNLMAAFINSLVDDLCGKEMTLRQKTERPIAWKAKASNITEQLIEYHRKNGNMEMVWHLNIAKQIFLR